MVVGPAVTGPVEVGPAETGPALSANCGSDGRRARVRARGKRVEGRVCSVTVAAVRLKEAWLRRPEGNRRPEPPPGVHLQAVGVKTVMYWSLNKISVYGDRVHGEVVHVSSQLVFCFYSLRGLLYSSREYHVPSPVTQIWVGSKCVLRLELFTLPATPPRSWGPVLTSSENVGFKVSPMRPPQAAPRPCRCS